MVRAQYLLRTGLGTLAELRGLVVWLSGEDMAKGPRTRGLGGSASSRHAMANGSAADAATILGWLAEVIDPPARPEPVSGPVSRAAAPVEAG